MQTQEAFFQANQVDGWLTDAQMAEMLFLPEVDTTALPVESSEPAAAAAPATPEAQAAAVEPPVPAPPASEPPAASVVLAKDGVHTIPFSELERARAAEKSLSDQLAAAQQELEALKSAPPAPAAAPAGAPATPAPASGEFEVDLGDFSEGALKDGIKAAVAAGVAAQTAALVAQIDSLKTALAPLQEKVVVSETDAHFNTINSKHPDIESIVPSQQFDAWIKSQPSFAQPGIRAVLEQGSADQVIELFDTYKAAAGIKTPTPPPPAAGAVKTATVDPAVVAAANAAIAAARSPAPNSLSEIPAGSAAHHDPAAAVLDMSATQQMEMLMGKSPEQIAELMSRVL